MTTRQISYALITQNNWRLLEWNEIKSYSRYGFRKRFLIIKIDKKRILVFLVFQIFKVLIIASLVVVLVSYKLYLGSAKGSGAGAGEKPDINNFKLLKLL